MSRIIRSKSSGVGVAIFLLILALLLIVAAFFGIAYASANGSRTLKGITVNNSIYVGDMTLSNLQDVLDTYQYELNNKPYVVRYEDSFINFHGSDIGVKIPEDTAKNIFAYGKSGDIISNGVNAIKSFLGTKNNIEVVPTYDKELLEEQVKVLIADSNSVKEDAKSEYDEKKGTITLIKGHDGITPNYNELNSKIQNDISNTSEALDTTLVAEVDESVDIDIEALYNSIYVEAKDAEYTKGGSYKAEQIGISFDKNKVLSDYRALKPDEKMVVTLTKTEPKITTKNLDSVLFADVLGSFKTNYNAGNTNRSNNLALAANSINNKIYLPGEEFSYNKELGERTAARGYKEAHVYSGGQVVDGLGGGICQISSTLYNAVLIADLEVTDRTNHMFFPEYVKPSFDATVAWGAIDFKFKNNRETPIKIVASAKGGVASVTIYGMKTDKDYTISLVSNVLKEYPFTTKTTNDPNMAEGTQKVTQSGVKGYKSEAYKVYKDASGKEVNRVKVSTDEYKATTKMVSIGTKKAEVTPVTPTPTPTPTAEPTTPTTPATPVQENPVVPETPSTPSNNTKEEEKKPSSSNNSGWPTGWDTPENPNFRG